MFGHGCFQAPKRNADTGNTTQRVVWRIFYVEQGSTGSQPVKKHKDVSSPARIGKAIERILATAPNVSTFAVQKTLL